MNIQINIWKLSDRNGLSKMFAAYFFTAFICVLNATTTSKEPPKIQHFENQVIYLQHGQDFEYFCNATGNPNPIIIWSKGGTDFKFQGNPLRLSLVSNTDSGLYICTAYNKVDPPDSQGIFVQVLWTLSFEAINDRGSTVGRRSRKSADIGCIEKENDVIGQEVLQVQYHGRRVNYLREGQDFEMFCNASGNSKPSIVWTKQDSDFEYNGTTLLLTSVTVNDAGLYICTADNYVDPPDSERILVEVLWKPPIITIDHPVVTVYRGSRSAELGCDAKVVYGSSDVTVTYWKITDQGQIQIHSSFFKYLIMRRWEGIDRVLNTILYIERPVLADSGTYICKAEGEFGNAEKQITLTVL